MPRENPAATAVFVQSMGICCALGHDVRTVRQRLFSAQFEPLSMSDAFSPGRSLPLGVVVRPGPHDLNSFEAEFAPSIPLTLRSRTNALAGQALKPLLEATRLAVEQHGPARVAVVLGSSTAGVAEGEAALRHRQITGDWPASYHYAQQEMVSPARFVAHMVGARGPVYGISTACSSGAKALAAGARLLQSGWADAVICGGADALCHLTVEGFSALDSVSPSLCNPFSRNRNGISLGEGAALFLLTRSEGLVRLAGWGETSDAHHMSAPDPSGQGAERAMRLALARAGIAPEQVDYLNLHGTATLQNDAMESLACRQVFSADLPVSSTKPLTGHALAAAGALEAAFAWMTLVDNPSHALPPHWWDGQADERLKPLNFVSPGARAPRKPQWIMSNSFAFGGSNASLLFART